MQHQQQFDPHDWVKRWEDELKNPSDLFTSMSIANVCYYLLEELKSKNSKTAHVFDINTYEKELIDYILHKIKDRKNYEKKIYSNNVLRKMRSSSKHKIVTRKHLELLSANQFNLALVKRLNNLFRTSIENCQYAELSFLIKFILRFLLNEYSSNYLSNLPKRKFSESYFGMYRDAFYHSATDSIIIGDSEQILNNLLKNIRTNSQNLEPNYRKIFARRIRWKDNVDDLTTYARAEFENFDFSLDRVLTISYRTEFKNKSREIINRFVKKTIKLMVSFVVSESLDSLERTIGHGFSHPDFSFDVLSLKIFGQIPLKQYAFPETHTGQAYFSAFVKLLNKYIPTKLEYLVESESAILSDLFFDFIKKNDRNSEIANSYFKNNFFSILHLFDFKLVISKYAKNFIKRNFDIMRKELTFLNTKDQVVKIEEYVSTTMEDLYTELQVNGFNLIPSSLSIIQIVTCFENLFKSFYEKNRSWRIFFLISDMNCDNKIFTVGDLVVYDARIWDLGESNQLDTPVILLNLGELRGEFRVYLRYREGKGKIRLRRNSARAFIDVNAKDPKMAINRAKTKLFTVIDSLVFASSAREKFGGHKPQIWDQCFATDKDGKGGVFAESIPFMEMLKIDDRYMSIATFYDKFTTSTENKFKNRIERSLSWFNFGKWNTFPHERFVAYWIGLEQLIADKGSPKKKSLLSLIPSLSVNWRVAGGSFAINQHLNEIIRLLNTNDNISRLLNNDSVLKNWKYNTSVFINNLPRLRKKLQGTVVERSAQNFEDYLQRYDRSNLISNTEGLQKLREFTIANLYSIRNQIMHEGLSYSPHIEFLLIELEGILIDTILALLGFGNKKNMSQIIDELNRPFYTKPIKLEGYDPKKTYSVIL